MMLAAMVHVHQASIVQDQILQESHVHPDITALKEVILSQLNVQEVLSISCLDRGIAHNVPSEGFVQLKV
jgi:hypothetical protein